MKSFPFQSKKIEEVCLHILNLVRQNNGTGYLVGGCVRDALIGKKTKDIDIEVYGIALDKLIKILKAYYGINFVGKSFGVIKLNQYPIDISIPRRERKKGQGYRGFDIETDHLLPAKEASARRDFTINAILFDPLENKIIDHYQGKEDLKKRILRHTTEKFSEDPLRVLRAMQFIARFQLKIAPETLELCRNITIENLSPERIFEEWKKLILKGEKISQGLIFLKDSGWLKYFPELNALCGCLQYKKWHPEGDVFVHTGFCMDAFVLERHLCLDSKENLLVGLGVLCHDFGKPLTTVVHPDGKITSHRHDIEGVTPTMTFLNRLTNQKDILQKVSLLVRYHMIPRELYINQSSEAAILRLSKKVGNIQRLLRVCKADKNGKGAAYEWQYPVADWLLEKAQKLQVTKAPPSPILKGRHLIMAGLKPSKEFSELLNFSYQAQLDKKISTVEEGIMLLEKEKKIKTQIQTQNK
jgi:tRNA nucleotidyltransferase (CCA-adding enzyme)